MGQSVDKLKELLFDNEARALDALVQRVEGIEDLTRDEKRQRENIVLRIDDERRLREIIAARIDDVFNRAGTADRFELSVAEVLDGALRRAEVDRHTELANAIAPLVVRTVKAEIRNSRDDLVEVLYPMTGRMVQAYVASAMKDLNNDINRKLEQNPVMLRLRSLASGKSVAEMAIAESQRLVVEELYLIRRGSGELVGRWPEAPDGAASRDHVMSGVLTAINEFSTEALKDDGSALRQIDLGERQLYLRVSPSFLLAAKCCGSASQAVEGVLDHSFLEAMEELQTLSQSGDVAGHSRSTALLATLSQNLEQRLDDQTGGLATRAAGASPLKMLAWIVGLPLAAWLTWSLYADYRTERARTLATRALTSVTELKGYPVSLDVSRLGRELTVSGLSPSLEVKDALLSGVRSALPGSVVTDRVSVLPSDLSVVEPRLAGVKRDVNALTPEIAKARDDIADVSRDVGTLAPEVAEARTALAAVDPKIKGVRDRLAEVENEFQAAAVERALDRVQLRLAEAKSAIAGLAAVTGPPLDRDEVRRATSSVESGLAALTAARSKIGSADGRRSSLDDKNIAVVAGHIRAAQTSIAALGGLSMPAAPAATGGAAAKGDTPDVLAADADRLANIALATTQIIAVKRAIPPPVQPLLPSAREKLIAFARANAVFFTNEVDFRAPQQTIVALDELAALMRGNDLVVRVVGYTDDQGRPDRNTALSEARSSAVIAALAERGISANRFIKLGRVDSIGISQERGASSPNRRVEFEVAFVGEAGP